MQLTAIKEARFRGDEWGSSLDVLLQIGKASIGMIAAKLDIDTDMVKQQLNDLIKIGLVEIEIGPRGHELYRLRDMPDKSPLQIANFNMARTVSLV